MMRRFPSVLFTHALTLRLAHAWRTRRSSRVVRQSDKSERAVATLSAVVPLLSSLRIRLAIENHWGITSRPENIVRIVRAVDSELVGTCPDFGNFPPETDIYGAVEMLMPYAKSVSAKSYDFDEKGDETKIDYYRMMKIVLDAGYRGYVGIEFEGGGDEYEGVHSTKKLLERCQEKFAYLAQSSSPRRRRWLPRLRSHLNR